MKHKINNFASANTDYAYVIFRVLIGALFSFHGMQKLFGWFTQNGAQPLLSLMGVVGVIELIGGVFILLGLFSRVSAVVSGIVMIVAYFKAHFTIANPIPIANRGELALVYLAAFIFIAFAGSGKCSLDKFFKK